MANELTVTLSMQHTNGTHKETFNPAAFQVDQAGSGSVGGMLFAPTTGINLVTSDTTPALGYTGFTNIDAAIAVNWGVVVNSTYHEVGVIPAGKSIVVAFSTTPPTIRFQSQSGVVKVKPVGVSW